MDTPSIIALIILIAPWALFIHSKIKTKKLRKELNSEQETIEELKKLLSESQYEVKLLTTKYSTIIDMELHTQQIIDDANEKSASILCEAERIKDETKQLNSDARQKLSDANDKANQLANDAQSKSRNIIEFARTQAEKEAEEIKVVTKQLNSEARQKLSNAKEKAKEITDEARSESERIIEFAQTQAQEIAGSAYEAKEKADLYEATIRAMRNTIEGYKDDYIIPNHSVLDDLAEDYSHKEAGEQLKAARKRVRTMIKEGYAGECDYVEANRKQYAIHFAVDAFNGKVDSALSKVKHNNYGKIKQELIDAFALVNHNGSPFRNARITQEYLDVRLEELKWAVATHELRQKELEEQREIKQQIREEEKARREMEKAIKTAEKEERLIQKALEKARAELASANEEQKQQYEAQLAELEGKLQEAEERGQRAMSMAQQTRRGHVYVISNIGSFGKNVFKIGMTRRLEPMDRVKELGDASVPFSFDVHAMLFSEDAPALEKELHRRFDLESVNKVNPRKEFFNVSLAEIKEAVEHHGVTDAHWTMKAEATEYRESQAIAEKRKAEVTEYRESQTVTEKQNAEVTEYRESLTVEEEQEAEVVA